MLKRFFALLGLLALFWPAAVYAQGEASLGSAEVDIWPEYDQPGVLVIYHLKLSPNVPLPTNISVRIPASAGKPSAVATRQADGQLMNLAYTQETSGEWTTLTMQAASPELQIEYYDPNLVKNGNARHFEYRWPGDYAVDSMNVQVQQPVDTTNMRISPNLGTGTTGSDLLTYYTSKVGALKAGQAFNITLDYQKGTDALSAASLRVQPSAPINGDIAGSTPALPSALPLFLAGLGLALLVGGAIWYWRSGRWKDEDKADRRRHKPSAQREAAAVTDSGGYIYCHHCGKRASAGDRFCRTCGTELRI